MKQTFQNLGNGKISLDEVPVPAISADEVLVRTSLTLISSGTEKMLLGFGRSSLLRKVQSQPERVKDVLLKIQKDGFFATLNAVKTKLSIEITPGYCSVGTVVDKGKNVKDIEIGDRVVSNGGHAEYSAVGGNLIAKIPDSVSDSDALFSVVGAIALHSVRLSKPTFGDRFLVLGAGLIGILVAKFLKAHGAVVTVVDVDDDRVEAAKNLGFDTLKLADDITAISAVLLMRTDQIGFDGVIIAAGTKSKKPIGLAAEVLRKRGRMVLVGDVGLSLDRKVFYEKEIKFQVSCSYGPGRYDRSYEELGIDYPIAYVRWTEKRNFEAFLSGVESGALVVDDISRTVFEFDKISDAYEELLAGSSREALVIDYNSNVSQAGDLQKQIVYDRRGSTGQYVSKLPEGRFPKVSFVGAGNYAISSLLPAFRKTKVEFRGLLARTANKSNHARKKFGFQMLSTDADQFFDCLDSDLVIVATRHDSHFKYAKRCLENGVDVWVEKPLVIFLEQLDEIESLLARTQALMTVGFNRRFSPAGTTLKSALNKSSGPIAIQYDINAGFVDSAHWVHDPRRGGGRIIGECIHFVDFCVFLTGSQIVQLDGVSLGSLTKDTVSLNLSFKDGSIANINYFANGSRYIPKERVRVNQHGVTFEIDNFKSVKKWGDRLPLWRSLTQNKGQREMIEQVFRSIETREPLIPYSEILDTHRHLLTFCDAK